MNERNAGRWLAVPAGGDSVTLLPMDGAGPDFFVKASDYDALRAEVERLKSHRKQLIDVASVLMHLIRDPNVGRANMIRDAEEWYSVVKRIQYGLSDPTEAQRTE